MQAVGADDDTDLVAGFGGFEVDGVDEVADLFDADDARFGFGAEPVDVGVELAGDASATGAEVAGGDRGSGGGRLGGGDAVDGRGQFEGDFLEGFR